MQSREQMTGCLKGGEWEPTPLMVFLVRWGGVERAGDQRSQVQAGVTWLEVTTEDWVFVEDVVLVSSSPNGFFPQHRVTSM